MIEAARMQALKMAPDTLGFPLEVVRIGERSRAHPTTYVFHTIATPFTLHNPEKLEPFVNLNPEGDTMGINLPPYHRLKRNILLHMMIPDGTDKLRFVTAALKPLMSSDLEEESMHPVILAGASSGGRWAASLAAQCEGSLDKLVIIDPPGVSDCFSLRMLDRVRRSEHLEGQKINRKEFRNGAKWVKEMFLNRDLLGRFYGVQYAKKSLFADFKKALDKNPDAQVFYFTAMNSLINEHAASQVLVETLFLQGDEKGQDYRERFHWIPIEGHDHKTICTPSVMSAVFDEYGITSSSAA